MNNLPFGKSRTGVTYSKLQNEYTKLKKDLKLVLDQDQEVIKLYKDKFKFNRKPYGFNLKQPSHISGAKLIAKIQNLYYLIEFVINEENNQI